MKFQPLKKNLNEEERAEAVKTRKIAEGELPTLEKEVDGLKSVSSALIGGEQVDDVTAAKQLNHALCLFANTLPPEEALVISSVFPEWDLGKKYKKDQYLRYGLNADNEPQIYRVISNHESQYAWAPDKAVSLFTKVGFTETGTALWIQPMGSHDSYKKGDKVSHKGVIYISDINGNVWEPGVYGWKTEAQAAAGKTK